MIVIQKELFIFAANGDLLIENEMFIANISEKIKMTGKYFL